MNTLNIDSVIKFEINDRISRELVQLGMPQKKFGKSEIEFSLVGSLKSRGYILYKIMTVAAATSVESLNDHELAARIDFRTTVVPRLLEAQKELEHLAQGRDPENAYWNLIDILSLITNFSHRIDKSQKNKTAIG